MLRNYVTLAVRNLRKHKLYAILNLLGLAVGMTCVMLIALFIQDECSYDAFYPHADRIYRVIRETHREDGTHTFSTGTSGALGPALVRDFPEAKQFVRRMSSSNHLVQYGEKKFYQRFCFADAALLDIFAFPLVEGDPKTALRQPTGVLLTEAMAEKFFGREDPMGKTLTVVDRYFGGQFTVTGVLKNMPHNSSLQFDFIASTPQTRIAAGYFDDNDWNPNGSYCPITTHIVLAPGASAEDLARKLSAFAVRYLGDPYGKRTTYHLQPLTAVHLHTSPDYGAVISFVDPDLQNAGDIRYVYAFGAVAGFILLIACANFVNLATAQATGRIREVGMRKVVGALRRQIAGQFLGESSLLALLSLILALGCVALALPAFNAFTGKSLALSLSDAFLVVVALVTVLFVGVLAGSYPALYLSAFQPAFALKAAHSGAKGAWIRKGLVVFQFALSILLIVVTVVIHRQLTFISRKKLGMNKDQIVILPLRRHPDFTNRWGLLTGHPLVEALRNELLRNPDILDAATFHSFIYEESVVNVQPEGMAERQMSMINGDEHFLNTFDIQLVKGKGFEKDLHIDADGWRDTSYAMPFLLNETAVKQLGWTHPIGKRFRWRYYHGSVVGVVRDFQNRSLREAVKPIFIMPSWKLLWFGIKIRTENVPAVMQFIKKTWSAFVPAPFDYVFLNDFMNQMYRSERRFEQLSRLFSLLAIAIACMGLWGLAAFTAERRTKEIGIRKTLGASLPQILFLFSKEFAYLVVLANLIAWPVAYYAMHRWLQGFAYRIALHGDAFLLGGILALSIALLTVSYQAWKAAQTNPVEALRYE